MTLKPDPKAKNQIAFRKAARELGCDPSEERFQDALRKIAKHKPDRPEPKKQGNWIGAD
jgi:hypothetical protein